MATYTNYKDSITAVISNLKTLFGNTTMNEAQAIAASSTKPNTIFYTSDTHNIVLNGQIYGRSSQVTANAFAYLPASVPDPSGDPSFGDTTKIYIQPTSTAGVMRLWWYIDGTWVSTDTMAMSVPISAEDITYDLTNTPDLGEGDVQSAIETLSDETLGKNEEVWVNMQYDLYNSEYGGQRQNAYIDGANPLSLGYSSSWAAQFFRVIPGETYRFKGTKAPNTNYKVAFYTEYKPKAGSNAVTLTDTVFVSGIKSTNSSTVQDFTVTVPDTAHMMIIGTVQNNAYKYHILGNSVNYWKLVKKEPVNIVQKAGRKIEGWTNSERINSNVAVGDSMPIWSAFTRGRGIVLDVKAGEVLLLDIENERNIQGLIFTDYDRVVTEVHLEDYLHNNTPVVVPNDGYAYIQDTGHKDCYIYNSDFGSIERRDEGYLLETDNVWIDQLYEEGGFTQQINNHAMVSNNNTQFVNAASNFRINTFKVEPGEVWRVEGLSSYVNNTACAWGVYDTYVTNISTATGNVSVGATRIATSAAQSANQRNLNFTITIPEGGYMLAISYLGAYNGDVKVFKRVNKNVHIHSNVENGEKRITEWSSNPCVHATRVALGARLWWLQRVGDTSGYKFVKYPVRKGEIVLADAYSAQWNALAFTNYNYTMVKRELSAWAQGMYEAPCDGYVFIQNRSDNASGDCCVYSNGHYGILKEMINARDENINMASMIHLGYGLRDAGAPLPIDTAGYKYASNLRTNTPTITGNCSSKYLNNTSLVYFPSIDTSGVTNGQDMLKGCSNLIVVPDLDFSDATTLFRLFYDCSKLKKVGNIYAPNCPIVSNMFYNCSAIEEIGDLTFKTPLASDQNGELRGFLPSKTHLVKVGHINCATSNMYQMFYNSSSLLRVESIDIARTEHLFTQYTAGYWMFYGCSNLRYIVVKNIGAPTSTLTSFNFAQLTEWGTASDEVPDARQSLIDSLITYSYDRAAEELSVYTITLSAKSKALLTESEIELITAKGYTIA